MENKESVRERDKFEVIADGDSYLIKFDDSSINIKKLDWDSGILGLESYRLENIQLSAENDFEEFINFIKLKFGGIDCMIYRGEANKTELIQNLLKKGFVLGGSSIKLSVNLDKEIDFKDDNIRFFKKEDVDTLSELARNTFLNAYRYNDKKFDKNKVDDLYGQWITNSCNGRADVVLVYEENNIPQGFIACNIKEGVGLIDLIAVSQETRGKGIGKKLVLSSLSWFKDKVSKVEVNTEVMNYASLRIYQNAGFKIVWVGFDLTYWFK